MLTNRNIFFVKNIACHNQEDFTITNFHFPRSWKRSPLPRTQISVSVWSLHKQTLTPSIAYTNWMTKSTTHIQLCFTRLRRTRSIAFSATSSWCIHKSYIRIWINRGQFSTTTSGDRRVKNTPIYITDWRRRRRRRRRCVRWWKAACMMGDAE